MGYGIKGAIYGVVYIERLLPGGDVEAVGQPVLCIVKDLLESLF